MAANVLTQSQVISLENAIELCELGLIQKSGLYYAKSHWGLGKYKLFNKNKEPYSKSYSAYTVTELVTFCPKPIFFGYDTENLASVTTKLSKKLKIKDNLQNLLSKVILENIENKTWTVDQLNKNYLEVMK